MPNEPETKETIKLGLKVASEFLLPGGSNLIKGDYFQAGVHAALGLFARAAFGIPGLLLVSSNSMSKAHTGRNLIENLGAVFSGSSEPEADETETARQAPRRQRKAARKPTTAE